MPGDSDARGPGEPAAQLDRLFALALWLGLPTFLVQVLAELVLGLGLRVFAPGYGVPPAPLDPPLGAPLRAAVWPLALLLGAGAAVAGLLRLIHAQPLLVRQVLDALAG